MILVFFCGLEILNYEYNLLQNNVSNDNNDFSIYNKIKIEDEEFDLKLFVDNDDEFFRLLELFDKNKYFNLLFDLNKEKPFFYFFYKFENKKQMFINYDSLIDIDEVYKINKKEIKLIQDDVFYNYIK